MMRLSSIVIVSAIALLMGSAAFGQAPPATPNVILVLVDDMGYADLGCYGSIFCETPNLDRLAKEGMRFTNAYAASAVCSPTRTSVLTGRYPTRLGITDWIRPLAGQNWTEAQVRNAPEYASNPNRKLLTPTNPRWMELEEITIAELLKLRGYATGFIGKWHLGPEGWFPEDQGFDVNIGGCDFGHPPDYFDPYLPKHQATTFPNLPPRKAGEYLTDREADEAVSFIRAHKDEPFFLYLCHYAVHSPIKAKQSLVEHYRQKTPPEGDGQNFPPYAAMVHSVDDAMGSILDVLDELELAKNTLIIFTSDNGGATHFRATDNRPLRSGKGRPYEGGIREPFIVRWPGRVPAGSQCDVPISTIDLLPTICQATATPLPTDRPVDGINLLPLLEQSGSIEREELFWHFPHYWWGGRVTPFSVLRRGEWKLIRWYETGNLELYNLTNDPAETIDLADQMPTRAQSLAARLDALLEQTSAKLPRVNPDYQDESAPD